MLLDELWQIIFDELGFQDYFTVIATCKRFNEYPRTRLYLTPESIQPANTKFIKTLYTTSQDIVINDYPNLMNLSAVSCHIIGTFTNLTRLYLKNIMIDQITLGPMINKLEIRSDVGTELIFEEPGNLQYMHGNQIILNQNIYFANLQVMTMKRSAFDYIIAPKLKTINMEKCVYDAIIAENLEYLSHYDSDGICSMPSETYYGDQYCMTDLQRMYELGTNFYYTPSKYVTRHLVVRTNMTHFFDSGIPIIQTVLDSIPEASISRLNLSKSTDIIINNCTLPSVTFTNLRNLFLLASTVDVVDFGSHNPDCYVKIVNSNIKTLYGTFQKIEVIGSTIKKLCCYGLNTLIDKSTIDICDLTSEYMVLKNSTIDTYELRGSNCGFVNCNIKKILPYYGSSRLVADNCPDLVQIDTPSDNIGIVNCCSLKVMRLTCNRKLRLIDCKDVEIYHYRPFAKFIPTNSSYNMHYAN